MPNYRRLSVPGGTYSFMVNLLERKRDLLVRQIDDLRQALRAKKRKMPFNNNWGQPAKGGLDYAIAV